MLKRIFLFSFLLNHLLIFAQWNNINPVPDGNTIFSVFFIDNSIGWIAGSDGLIKKTTDTGVKWVRQNSGTQNTIRSIFFINADSGWVSGDNGLILKSTNGGESWIQLFSGTSIRLNQIKFSDKLNGLVAGNNGIILKTTDGGISWVQTNSNLSYNILSVDYASDNIIFAAGRNEVSYYPVLLKSTDSGATWIDISLPFTFVSGGINTVEFINADTGYVGGGEFYTSIGYIFKTTDGGTTWQQLYLPLPKMETPSENHKLLIEDDYYGIRSIYFRDADNGYAVGGNGGGWRRVILQTTDGGQFWSLKYHGMEEYGLLSVTITSSGTGLATGFNGSIFRTENNGQSWKQQFSGGVFYGGEENIRSIFFSDSLTGWAGGSRRSFGGNEDGFLLMKSTDGGNLWLTEKYYYDIPIIARDIYFTDLNNGFVATSDGLQYTTDGGINWNVYNDIISVSSVYFINDQTGWLASDDKYNYKKKANEIYNLIAKSTDGGQTWVQKTTPGGNSIFFIDQNTGWVVGNNGSIRKSSDGGETWTTISAGVTSNLNSVRFKNINLGAICGDNGTVLITTDGGQTWILRITNINENLNSIIFKDENSLWCAGNNGIILESNNLGINWIVHNGLTDKNLKCLTKKPDNSIFIAGEKGSMLSYSAGTNPAQPYFSKVWSGNPYLPMNIYITSALVDGASLKAGDEIGVFDGDICVGSVILNDSIPSGGFISLVVSMDDPTTTEIDGFTPDDSITFRLWNSQLQEEITYVEANYLQSNGRFLQQGTAVVELNGRLVINQTIALSGGWNIVSLKTEPLNKNLLNVFEPLITGDILIKVQDETGNAIEKLPPPIGWINNIGNWSATEGYYTKIQPNSSATLITAGFKINLPLNIPLTAGWNIISYPLDAEQNAINILQELINLNHLIKVQDEAGNAIEYLPPPIGWINNIGNFKPGEGYYIKVSQNTVLTYNTPSKKIITDKKKIIAEEKAVSQEQLNTVWSGNPYLPMNIYITNLSNQTSGVLSPGDEIGIFDNEFCVGVKQLNTQHFIQGYIQIIASADDPTTDFTDGFISGHPMIIKLWDSESNQIIDVNSFTVISGNQVFEPLGTSVISFESFIPVELVNFRATVSNNTVELNWETRSETNNRGFEVERSQKSPTGMEGQKVKSQMEWKSIGFVEGKGTTTEPVTYSFTDHNLTSGKYAYRLKQIDVDGTVKYSDEIETEVNAPMEFLLEQNYPNPFNPTTIISWQSPVGSRQILKIYDILGNEVVTLVDEYREAGRYNVEFTINNLQLSSGVYYYRLKAGDYVETKKMILLK